MKCSNCGHDLMLGLAPEGLGKLLPVTTYTCVRCGHANRRLSETWSGRGPLLALVVVAIFVVGAAAWFELIGPGAANNSVRRGVVTTVEAPPPPTPPVVEEAPAPGPGTDAATPGAAEPAIPAEGQPAATETPTPAPEAATAAQAEVSPEGARPAALPAPAPPAPSRTAQPPAVAAQPAPAAAPAATVQAQDATQSKAESDLEEVEVAAPPTTARPKVEAKGGKTGKSAKAAGWNAQLTSMRVGDWKDARIVTLGVKGLAGDPKGFQLSSPPRYVVDVPGQWTSQVATSTPVNQGAIKTVRLGLYPDKLRIVLDLNTSPKQATVRRAEEGLVITVR